MALIIATALRGPPRLLPRREYPAGRSYDSLVARSGENVALGKGAQLLADGAAVEVPILLSFGEGGG
jgi:hypothetical protein